MAGGQRHEGAERDAFDRAYRELPAGDSALKLDEERARCHIEGRNPDDIPAQQSDGTTV